MLLFVPVLVIPMLTLAFYALGGGKGDTGGKSGIAGSKGYNKNLPTAHFDKKDRAMDKLAFYLKADLDSAKLEERMKQDPNYVKQSGAGGVSGPGPFGGSASQGIQGAAPGKWQDAKQGRLSLSAAPPVLGQDNYSAQADAVLQKLEQLKRSISQPGNGGLTGSPEGPTPGMAMGVPPAGYPGSGQGSQATGSNVEVMGRMENVLQKMQQSSSATSDPQLDKLDGMLNKLLRIQHPEEVAKGDTVVPGPQPETMAMTAPKKDLSVQMLSVDSTSGDDAETGFINIDDQAPVSMAENTIPAVINQDQVLTAGATVELRLSEEAVIAGVHIPKDNLLYGVASLNGERLNISVTSIRYQQSIYPVSLQVYDLDGLAGIRIPGAITRDVTKESAEEGVNGLDVGAMSPTLGGQAVNAGVQATKTLLSRKIKLVRVSLKAGYVVLLKNTKNSVH